VKQTLHLPAPRVLAALKGDKTMSKLATQFDVHPNQIKQW
jgi:transposase-like protein